MRTLKLYGAGSATANAVASVQIPSRGRIRGIQYNLIVDSVTDNASIAAECSLASAREIGTNGAQQCVAEIGWAGNFATSGLAQVGNNGFLPASVEVVQGQLVYLHASVTGTLAYTCTFVIHYE
jgi:hypothetical protein